MYNLPEKYSPIKGLRDEEVMEALLKRFHVTREWLLEQRRNSKERIYIRQLGMLIIRRHVRATSLKGIAILFNRQDHATTNYALNEAKKRLESDPDFQKDYERVVAELMNAKDIRTGVLSKGDTLISQRLGFMKNSIYWLQEYEKGDANWLDADTAITNLMKNCEEIRSELRRIVIRHF